MECGTGVVRQERAMELAERVLHGLGQGHDEWPLSLIRELCVFGSFSRGATEPHDLDLDVEHEVDQRWAVHFADCLAYGRDHFSLMKRPLTGGKRGCQFTFNHVMSADLATPATATQAARPTVQRPG
jgi:predicted nucleotidyltransferase